MATDFVYGRQPLTGSEIGVKSYSTTLAAKLVVKLDTSNKESGASPAGVVVTAASTDMPFGVTVESFASGGTGRVQCYGIAVCTAGAAITAGDVVMPTSSGKVITQTSAKPQVGIAMHDAAADGDPVRVLLQLAKNALPENPNMAPSKNIVRLSDRDDTYPGGLLDVMSGEVYDQRGNTIGRMRPVDEDMSALSDYAATLAHREMAAQCRRPVTMTDASGDERLVTMDLGVSDVHQAAPLSNYAAGYKLSDGVADVAAPVLTVAKDTDKYYTWDKENAFQRVQPTAGANGGTVPEINPTLSNTSYQTVAYALGAFLPTEVVGNADAPLRPEMAAIRRVMNALKLEREIRVATLLTTSGNWDSSLYTNLAAGAKWNGGASSDPIKDLHTIIEASYAPVTGIIWSEKVEHDFVRNAQVQKYLYAKDGAAPLPTADQLSSVFRLPTIYTAKMKYIASSALTYVWGNSVVLLHQPPSMPPQDQEDVATALTFRWNGGQTSDGSMVAGWLVRKFFMQDRGGRGGQKLVVVHNDVEKMTSAYVGGLIAGAHQ